MHTLNFEEFLNEKTYTQGKPDAEENKASFYEKAKLKDDQKKAVESLVDKAAQEENINKGLNYKALIVGKIAGLDDKQIAELEKEIEEKHENFTPLVLLKLSKLTMEQGEAFGDL